MLKFNLKNCLVLKKSSYVIELDSVIDGLFYTAFDSVNSVKQDIRSAILVRLGHIIRIRYIMRILLPKQS